MEVAGSVQPVPPSAVPVMSLSDLAGPACGGRTTRLDKSDAVTSEFWMHHFKIDMCPRRDPHDWEQCLYAHRGEKARRRHPSKYKPVQCPEARAKTLCPRGDDCPCTHNLFEYWLHPDRFRTCICEQGPNCSRPICFFAHCEEERRPLPEGSSDPSMLPGAMPMPRNGGAGGGGGSAGLGGRHNRPGVTAMVVPALDPSTGVVYAAGGALPAPANAQLMMQQGGGLAWGAHDGRAAGGGQMQMLLQAQAGGVGGGGSVPMLGSSPALSAGSGGGVSYGSLSNLRSHTPSPNLTSNPMLWHDSQLMAAHGHPQALDLQAAAAAAAVGGGGPQVGDEADAILSFSLWDGTGAGPTGVGAGASAAAVAAQQQHVEQLQALQQQQLQAVAQQQQLQQLQQLQTAGRSGMFSGFESWSPMHSPLASPHAGRSGAVAAAAALSSAAAATGAAGALPKPTRALSGMAGSAMVAAAAAGRLAGATPGSTTASTTPAVSPAASATSGTQYQGLVLGTTGLAGLAISAPRAAVSPRQNLSPEFPMLLGTAPPSSSGASAPRSGTSTPHDVAAGGGDGTTNIAAQAAASAAASLRLAASVDALAQDLSTLLSPTGLRALSAKLAVLADRAEGVAAVGAPATAPANAAVASTDAAAL